MNSVIEAIRFAKQYLAPGSSLTWEESRLNGELQYKLCMAFDRMKAEFHEVTRRDIIMLCESWIMGNDTAPIFPADTPSIKGVSP